MGAETSLEVQGRKTRGSSGIPTRCQALPGAWTGISKQERQGPCPQGGTSLCVCVCVCVCEGCIHVLCMYLCVSNTCVVSVSLYCASVCVCEVWYICVACVYV